MLRRILIPAVSCAAFTVAPCFAQTPAEPAPANPNTHAPAAPKPQPGQAVEYPAAPAYAPNSVQTPQAPVAVPVAPPVVAPAQPTPQAPFGAMPPYAGADQQLQVYQPYGTPDERIPKEHHGSTYIPMDSWVYPEMSRLYSMGFAGTAFQSMKPYTRLSLTHILDDCEDDIRESDNDEAKEILAVIRRELQDESGFQGQERGFVYGTHDVYTRVMGISGTTLRDSYHIGQTIENDYGRPYQNGFNNITGFAALAERGRFSLFVRGEYQHSPTGAGYSQALSATLSQIDTISFTGPNLHQATIPTGPVAAQNPFRLVEATLSFHLLGHEISGGKSDAWLGPGQGGSLAWSNNAENIYSFRINRVEPLHIPFVSAVLGPLRYDFFYGSLKGHTAPNDDWTHSAMFSFAPTSNFQFGFQRTVVFGGHGHEPVTLHTFLKSFFDISDTTLAEKIGRNDPGARFSVFNASYRLPFVRNHVTFYVDSIAHDDVTPISAPRRAAFRTGLYLSQIPGMKKMDLRVEAADTDPITSRSTGGLFNYFESIQNQAYTNQGFIMGDWIGREGKGGQAWLTYHLSGTEWVQLEYLNKKNDKDFIPGGTTQNQFKAQVLKRFSHDSVELNAWFQYERWRAPVYLPGAQSNTVTAVQLTFFPGLKSRSIR